MRIGGLARVRQGGHESQWVIDIRLRVDQRCRWCFATCFPHTVLVGGEALAVGLDGFPGFAHFGLGSPFVFPVAFYTAREVVEPLPVVEDWPIPVGKNAA